MGHGTHFRIQDNGETTPPLTVCIRRIIRLSQDSKTFLKERRSTFKHDNDLNARLLFREIWPSVGPRESGPLLHILTRLESVFGKIYSEVLE